MTELNPAWLALIGTVLGASGLKVIEYWLSRGDRKVDTQTVFREELRKEIQGLRDELWKVRKEVDNTESDLDKWREKYYELLDNFIKVKSELDAALRTVQKEAQAAVVTLDTLSTTVVESLDAAEIPTAKE